MSQKKVDAYKAQKANRDKIIKKEKMMLRLEKCAAVVVCIVAICWVGFSVYQKTVAVDTAEEKVTEIDTSALDNYLSDITSDEIME